MNAPRPVWVRALTSREGDEVVTRCCVVSGGEFFPIEVRVNVPRLAAELRALGLGGAGHDAVAGFGSFLKKAVKTVTKNKIVKAVGKIVKTVASNPLVQIANPMLAIGTHTLLTKLGSRGTLPPALAKIVDPAANAAAAASGAPPLGAGALSFVSPKAAAALGVGLKAVTTAKAGAAIAEVAKVAQQNVALGKVAAQAIAQKTVDPKKALPLVKKAAVTRANVQKLAPALAKRVVASSKVEAQLGVIAQRANAGSPEAKQAAAVLARSARAIDQIHGLEQALAGGVAGLLVTATGQIVRAPRGRFVQRSAALPSGRADVLYRGARAPVLRGAFSAVSGGVGASPGWGGETDPGNDLEGPLGATRYAEGWTLGEGDAVAGAWTP